MSLLKIQSELKAPKNQFNSFGKYKYRSTEDILEALKPLLDRTIPGIEEAIRKYGQDRMPYAMLSRSVAGTIKNALVLALPGSTNGARESMDAIFPSLLHVFRILKGARHD